ncbi:phage protein Gp36 family protein [Geothrix fuzhouensis]|uniref:phage protein Gp36 family protein n=1 Tax=Geothrix fuzhouensis TaxID=2966451 RepID=UPI00214769AB|nr:phage protein Gp36 family protein [Geothrix fuzhouensis]
MAWFAPEALATRLSPLELRQLSTGDGRATAQDDTVLQAVLDRAETEVRSVLSGRGTLADTTPTGALADITLDLAVEGLFLRQPGAAAKLPEGWVDRLKRSRQLLDRFASGEIPISTLPVSHRLAALNPASTVDGAFL